LRNDNPIEFAISSQALGRFAAGCLVPSAADNME